MLGLQTEVLSSGLCGAGDRTQGSCTLDKHFLTALHILPKTGTIIIQLFYHGTKAGRHTMAGVQMEKAQSRLEMQDVNQREFSVVYLSKLSI